MTNHTATVTGFTLLYCTLMAGIIIVTIPYLEGWRGLIGLFLLLPCGVIGAALLLYGRLRRDDFTSRLN
jgi:hypothetical protein